MSFFTIGHSTRSTAEFAHLLQSSQVELIVDVRHIPRSRTNPQFTREILPDELQSFQIGYVHLAALGGLRSRGLETSPNLLWQNSSFRNYADYAMTEDFDEGLTELRNLGHKRRSAIMCAEAVGGAAIGGSSPIISFAPERVSSTFSAIALIGRC